jgi:hypothetical protein
MQAVQTGINTEPLPADFVLYSAFSLHSSHPAAAEILSACFLRYDKQTMRYEC